MQRSLTYVVFGAFLTMGYSAKTRANPSSLQSIVGALSGADYIAPGIQLRDRRSVENREVVRTYLSNELKERSLSPLRQTYRTGANIYGVLPAKDPENITSSRPKVLIGAHFDSVSRSPGANDNATGMALVLEVATALSKLECRSRDVVVVFFDEEERGLIGSRSFAKFLNREEIKLDSAHTVDQMGWDKDGDRAIELELPSRRLEEVYRTVAEDNGWTMPLHRTRTSSTDHSSFRREGFEAVGLTEEYVNGDTTPHYHRSSDTFETVDFGYLGDSTKFLTDVIGHLVRCEE